MGWQFWRREARNAENPLVPVSAKDFIEKFYGVVGLSDPACASRWIGRSACLPSGRL